MVRRGECTLENKLGNDFAGTPDDTTEQGQTYKALADTLEACAGFHRIIHETQVRSEAAIDSECICLSPSAFADSLPPLCWWQRTASGCETAQEEWYFSRLLG